MHANLADERVKVAVRASVSGNSSLDVVDPDRSEQDHAVGIGAGCPAQQQPGKNLTIATVHANGIAPSPAADGIAVQMGEDVSDPAAKHSERDPCRGPKWLRGSRLEYIVANLEHSGRDGQLLCDSEGRRRLAGDPPRPDLPCDTRLLQVRTQLVSAQAAWVGVV